MVKSLSEFWLIGFAGPVARFPQCKIVCKENLLPIWQYLWAQSGQVLLKRLRSNFDDIFVQRYPEDTFLVSFLENTSAAL